RTTQAKSADPNGRIATLSRHVTRTRHRSPAPTPLALAAAFDYSTANAAAASASRSRYWSLPTLTATPRIVPTVNLPGDLYSWLTLSPLSHPTHRPSPESVNFPACVRIGPSATTLSLT